MANDERNLVGLRPLDQPYGNIRIGYYRANTARNIFKYQPVMLNNSGQVQVGTLIADCSGILGTVVGFVDANKAALPPSMDSLSDAAFLTNGNNAYVAVADDPNQLFTLEEDTGGTLIGSANSAGQTVSFTYLGTTGDTVTGIANAVLDRSTLAAGTGGVFTIVEPYDIINSDGTLNTPTGNFCKWVVRISTHQNGPMALANPALRAS